MNLHLLQECGVGIVKLGGVFGAEGGARVEEVDTEVGVVSLHRLRDVLHRRYVERRGRAKHRQHYGLVLPV